MATISEIVKIRTGYANFVELKSSFEKDQENLDRMAMYRPTTAHRRAFQRLCRGLFSPTDKKFYLLTGSYGTGKSHLCLMFANFLSRSSGDPEVAGFYDNYEKLDAEEGKKLRNLRKGGQYLVAICDYNSGQNFEDVVLKAVLEACEAKGIESLVQTQHDEAERLLANWEAKSGDAQSVRDFYEDFSRSLEKIAPAITVEQLREGLRGYDSTMLETFRDAYREAQGGTEFQSQAGNLIPILKKLVKSQEFKSRFKGLVILFDEFGFTLEKVAYSKDILQGFMEKICQNEPNILFVGCIHKNFDAYADRFSKSDAKVMSARITHVNLLNEGIEEIIGAIIETDKTSTIWQEEVKPKLGVLDTMLPVCEALQLFPWIKETQRIRERVLEDIYGVHPIALACLLKLSSEIGSDARSTFTFFTGDTDKSQGSYANFIENAELTVNGGKLNLYTVAGLYDFFSKELDLKNSELRDRQRQLVNGYNSSELALQKGQMAVGEMFATEDDTRILILKIILLYQLCNIPTSPDNIFFGYYGLNAQRKTFDKQIKKLDKMGAVFYRKQSNTYELAAVGGEDPYDLIDRYVDDPEKHPADLVRAFVEEAGDKKELTYLEAKQYNLTYNEDKRLLRVFKKAKDLGPELWKALFDEMVEAEKNCGTSYEGIAVYCLCEDDTDIKIAKDTLAGMGEKRIVLSIPHEPQPFTEALIKVKACRYYLQAGEAEKLNPQTEARFRDLFENSEDGLLPKLKTILNQIVSGESACWYGKDGVVVVDMPMQSHKPADHLCEELFSQRCRIKHPDLNFVHDDKWKNARNRALKEAVTMLLSVTTVQIDNGNPDNHGEKKYLEKVLLRKAGALRKIRSEDNVTFFECERDDSKISDTFPVLKEIIERLNNLPSGKTFQVGSFLKEVKGDPWGAGETALMLSLSHVISAYGERLRIYKDSTKMVEEHITDYAGLEKVMNNPAPKLVFEVKDISPVQEELIEGIASAVHATKLLHGEKRSLTSMCDALKLWWKELPKIAKVKTVYEADEQGRVENFKKNFDKLTGVDRYVIIFGIIPEMYGEDQVTATDEKEKITKILENFTKDIQLLETGEVRAQNKVAGAIGELFDVQGDIVECEKAVKKWFEGLNPNQRDATRYDTEPDAQSFIQQLAHPSAPYKTKLMKSIPNAFGLDSISDWGVLRTTDYIAKLKQAKEEVEAAAIIIPLPEIKGKEKFKKISDLKWEVEDGGSLEIVLTDGLSTAVYTLDGSDPRSSSTGQKISESTVLDSEFSEKPAIKVSIRGLDSSGNYSDCITCLVVNKSKEYEVHIGQDDMFTKKGTFKVPDSLEALKKVLTSTVEQAQKDRVITGAQADSLKDMFKNL